MCWHKWDKWKDFIAEMVMINSITHAKTDYKEERQARFCLKCGKKQVRIVQDV